MHASGLKLLTSSTPCFPIAEPISTTTVERTTTVTTTTPEATTTEETTTIIMTTPGKQLVIEIKVYHYEFEWSDIPRSSIHRLQSLFLFTNILII